MSKPRFTRRVLALVLALVVIAASCGVSRDGASDDPAATLSFADGTAVTVTKGDVADLADGLQASPEFTEIIGFQADQLETISLDQLIRTEVITHVLETNGGSLSTEDIAGGRDLLDRELLDIFSRTENEDPAAKAAEVAGNIDAFIEALATQIGASEKLPEILTADLEGSEVPCVRHILLESEADALQVVDDIEAGADFAEVAMERSTGPSGPSGGELGCASADGYVPEFRDAVLTAEIGTLVGPVQTDFGFHVLEVTAVEEVPADPNLAIDLALQEVYDGLVIEVDEDLGSWDPSTRQVLPPALP